MKKFYIIFLAIILLTSVYSQQAQDYFPADPGYKWDFFVYPLDSMNNEITESSFRRADLSAFIADYEGREAYYILSKTGTDETINLLPYTDTNYINLSDSQGYEYFNFSGIQTLINALNSIGVVLDSSFLNIFNSLKGWYSFYRFEQNVNQQYQVISFDTTLTIDSLTLPLRYEIRGRRYQDEEINTEIGSFECKKFLITNVLSYLIILPPPLPPIVIPIVQIPDTLWIAPENWIVRSFIPSTVIDLSLFGFGTYIIPGLKTEILAEVTNVEQNSNELLSVFSLKQNYPNPFNPSTKINFILNKAGLVNLKVYDILGNEIDILVNKELSPGEYNINFDGSNLASGIYFYNILFSELSGLSYTETKQMMLIK